MRNKTLNELIELLEAINIDYTVSGDRHYKTVSCKYFDADYRASGMFIMSFPKSQLPGNITL
jgi:hypothetical protein